MPDQPQAQQDSAAAAEEPIGGSMHAGKGEASSPVQGASQGADPIEDSEGPVPPQPIAGAPAHVCLQCCSLADETRRYTRLESMVAIRGLQCTEQRRVFDRTHNCSSLPDRMLSLRPGACYNAVWKASPTR